jgi:predicted nucleic acid-binding Zn finger protein
MGSGQRERGGAVVERGWSPCAHTVAAGAVL